MRRAPGFTFVEMLIVTVVLMLIGGMAIVMAQTGPRVWTHTSSRLASITNGQRALDRVIGDLRAASSASVNCAPPAPNELTFTQLGAPVSYDLNGTNLLKNGRVIAGDLSTFRCTRFADGHVRIEVGVRVDASTVRTLTSQVWVRQP